MGKIWLYRQIDNQELLCHTAWTGIVEETISQPEMQKLYIFPKESSSLLNVHIMHNVSCLEAGWKGQKLDSMSSSYHRSWKGQICSRYHHQIIIAANAMILMITAWSQIAACLNVHHQNLIIFIVTIARSLFEAGVTVVALIITMIIIIFMMIITSTMIIIILTMIITRGLVEAGSIGWTGVNQQEMQFFDVSRERYLRMWKWWES